jgi:flagellar motor switch protein FliM
MSDDLRIDELEALMSSATFDAQGEREVATYDFKRPKRVAQEQMRTLSGLHENLVRRLEYSFATLLRQIVDVSLVSVIQLTYEEFIASLSNPTCFALLGIKDTTSKLALEMRLDLVFAMIDRLLGGKGVSSGTARELTELEWTIVKRIVTKVIDDYEEAWQPIQRLEFVPLEQESNPHQAQFLGPNEPVIVIVINLKMGDVAGILHICFPFASLKPLLHTLKPKTWLEAEEGVSSEDEAAWMRRHAGRTNVRMSADIVGPKITVRNLLSLRPGDVLRLGVPLEHEVSVAVNGLVKFGARAVSRSGRKAIRLTRVEAA